MRFRVARSVAILGMILPFWLFGCTRATRTPLYTGATPITPAVSSTRCWLYDRIHPAMAVTTKTRGLSSADRLEIEMWTRRVSPYERPLVRWIRDPRNNDIYIFIAEPERPGTVSAWVALNANVAIDVHQCWLPALPGA